MKWISVADRLPTNTSLKKFKVKMSVGSMSVKEVETTVLGRMYLAGGFRFMSGDWQEVTHWLDGE